MKRLRVLWLSLAVGLMVLALAACSTNVTGDTPTFTGNGMALALPGQPLELNAAPAVVSTPLVERVNLAITAGADAASRSINAIDVYQTKAYSTCGG